MALLHSDGLVEIACNLLDPSLSPPAAVQAYIEQLAGVDGWEVQRGYSTGKTVEELLEIAKALPC